MTILIVGGGGFIGSNLAATLRLATDQPIVVCDDLNVSPHQWKNLRAHPPDDLIGSQELNAWLGQHANHVSAIINMASSAGSTSVAPKRSWHSSREQSTEFSTATHLAVNYHLRRDLWRWCHHHEIPYIYGSTSATFGDGTQGFFDTTNATELMRMRPLTAWAFSQQMFDIFALRAASENKAPPHWYGLKMFHVYGPNEYHKSTAMSLPGLYAEAMRRDLTITIPRSYDSEIASGLQKRDFIWIDDVCTIVCALLLSRKPKSGLISVGSGKANTLKALVDVLAEAFGKEATTEIVSLPLEDRLSQSYFEQARLDSLRERQLNLPFTSLKDGIARYVGEYHLGRSLFR